MAHQRIGDAVLIAAAVDPAALTGPIAALALALLFLGLFYTGRILSRNTVPREDYKALQDVNLANAETLRVQTQTLTELVAAVRHLQRNGGVA